METNSKEPSGSSDKENLAETRRLLAELNSMARELESERKRDRLSLSRRRLNDGLPMFVAPMQAPPMPPASLLHIAPAPDLLPPPNLPAPPINRKLRLSLKGQQIQRDLVTSARRDAVIQAAAGVRSDEISRQNASTDIQVRILKNVTPFFLYHKQLFLGTV